MDTTHPDADWRGSGLRLFPAFSLPVVSRDDWLIPFEREIILVYGGPGGRPHGRADPVGGSSPCRLQGVEQSSACFVPTEYASQISP
jgi:hypothetical protein